MLIVNRAIAAKFGEITTDPSPLELEDWSDCGLPFKLAVAVLNDEYEQASSIMRQLGTDHEMVSRTAYGNWPLFQEFREHETFLNTYRELFGEAFDVLNPKDSQALPADPPYETNRPDNSDTASPGNKT